MFLFQNHSKLKRFFTTKYFDFQEERIAPFSTSEKIMLNLALHLFNERNKFNLTDIDYLDSHNKDLAFKAMRMRFNY